MDQRELNPSNDAMGLRDIPWRFATMHTITESDGVIIDVELESWCWQVWYKDGTTLKQFGDDGIFHRIGEVEQERLEMATLYKHSNPSQRIDIPWREGMRLVHKYVNYKNGDTREWTKVYQFGYKYEGQHAFNMVLPDDRIIFTPDADTVDLPLYI